MVTLIKNKMKEEIREITTRLNYKYITQFTAERYLLQLIHRIKINNKKQKRLSFFVGIIIGIFLTLIITSIF